MAASLGVAPSNAVAELTPADVQTFTSGRLLAADGQVADMLTAALKTARKYVGWHVSPVRTDHSFTMDGPDSRVLILPTRKLIALTAIAENGTDLDVSTVGISAGDGPDIDRPVGVRKRSGSRWTGEYGGIEVTMTHGYTETEAADWRRAVLSMVDQMSQIPIRVASGAGEIASIKVDDVTYGYRSYDAAADEALVSVNHLLTDYSLPAVEFI
jgi:hypothetical protein